MSTGNGANSAAEFAQLSATTTTTLEDATMPPEIIPRRRRRQWTDSDAIEGLVREIGFSIKLSCVLQADDEQ